MIYRFQKCMYILYTNAAWLSVILNSSKKCMVYCLYSWNVYLSRFKMFHGWFKTCLACNSPIPIYADFAGILPAISDSSTRICIILTLKLFNNTRFRLISDLSCSHINPVLAFLSLIVYCHIENLNCSMLIRWKLWNSSKMTMNITLNISSRWNWLIVYMYVFCISSHFKAYSLAAILETFN